MARVKKPNLFDGADYIARPFACTRFKATVYNKADKTASEREFTVTGNVKQEGRLETAAKKQLEEGFKLIAVDVETAKVETRTLAMTVETFKEHAVDITDKI